MWISPIWIIFHPFIKVNICIISACRIRAPLLSEVEVTVGDNKSMEKYGKNDPLHWNNKNCILYKFQTSLLLFIYISIIWIWSNILFVRAVLFYDKNQYHSDFCQFIDSLNIDIYSKVRLKLCIKHKFNINVMNQIAFNQSYTVH